VTRVNVLEPDMLNVTVWFGTNEPSAALYGQANEELARLLVHEKV
jgi:hypothetical protein